MKSLKTSVKRDAERLSRRVSVDFDTICHEALQACSAVQSLGAVTKGGEVAQELQANAESVISEVPRLIRLAAIRVVEEQQRNPAGWLDVVKGWQSLYEAMKVAAVPREIHQPAMHAQAILNGIELAIQGRPIPAEVSQPAIVDKGEVSPVKGRESWPALCSRALNIYREQVGSSRYQLAESRLLQVRVHNTEEQHIQAGLLEWSRSRLEEVTPRTVKSQLDCMACVLRVVLPKLKTPFLKELKGVMQPRTSDRQSMPIQAIQEVLGILKNRPASKKVRTDYGGGASQFDAIAVEVLAVLGMRPRELMQARTNALCDKTDVFGTTGLYFRVIAGKNKASERDIPLSDGTREVVDVSRLREMLKWQEGNLRAPHGAVSSLGTRFKKATNGYTLYQMRHSWKDIAQSASVDLELRERIMGHKMPGVTAIYGSGIPLREGLNALEAVRSNIYK